MRTLITGGVRSGKSAFALELALRRPSPSRTLFLATATPFDGEMRARIERHRSDRGERFRTVEEPIEIARHAGHDLLLDCLTMWMNNVFHSGRAHEWELLLGDFLADLGKNAIIVTNETGLGIIPDNELSRRYQEALGRANCRVAAAVDEVVFMVSGLPLWIKGGPG